MGDIAFQSNIVSDFPDFVCSLFPKAILFDLFYSTIAGVVPCGSCKMSPLHHHSVGCILFPLGFLFDLDLTSLSTFFSHIATVSGCGRELNAHFYSAASLKYHAPDTLT